jgi:hypothetical protein
MKLIMKKNISLTLFLLLIISFGNIYGQDLYKSCGIKDISVVKSTEKHYQDTVLLTYIETDLDLKLTISNFKKDTIYLFSTYFDSKFYNSPNLHRFDKSIKNYKVSFLPFLPHLFLKTNSEDRTLDNQNIYSFIIIPPNFNYTLSFPFVYLFPNLVTADFDLKNVQLSKNSLFEFGKKTKKLSLNKINSIQNISFEFSYYSNISFICETSNMYLDTDKFRNKALQFNTLTKQIAFTKYKHRLLQQK